MNQNDITRTLAEQLAPIGLPIVYGNKDKPDSVTRPYLIFNLIPSTGSAPRISGGLTQSGFAQIMLVSDLDKFETYANDTAASIAALFPYEAAFPCAGGKVTITAHTVPKGGYRADSDWLKPIDVDYIAI